MRQLVVVLLLIASSAVAQQATMPPVPDNLPPGAAEALKSVNPERIKADVRFLSSDLLEGRGTGARGGDIAAEYIAAQFAIAGLRPAGEKGSYMQKVDMVGISTQPGTSLKLKTPKQTLDLKPLDEAVIMDESQQASSDVSGDVVFVGYGITAPEFKWNDFAGLDVKGKVLLMFVNEPPSDDDKFFNANALTYYGRWTYKFENAARLGAAGVILIHKTEMASYGWDVVRSSWSGERSYLAGDKAPRLRFASWIQLDVARKMLSDAGQDLDALLAAAGKPGFKPVPLPITTTAHVVSKVRPFESNNVVGMLPGSDPKLAEQAVVYTAHYDHLGVRPEMSGDNIYNGANDNASGTAMIIEMARVAAASPTRPGRSLIFAAVTAEEQGLWGSNYLAQHPPVPVNRIALNLNFDSFAPLGIPRQISAGGYERTDFGPVFEKTATDFGLSIKPPEHPESGGYYRSDHFSFARVGVPAFSLNAGRYEGRPETWVKERATQLGKCYHQPCDQFMEDGDYRANAQIVRFGLALGYRAANLPNMVQWKPGDEFEAARKAQGQ